MGSAHREVAGGLLCSVLTSACTGQYLMDEKLLQQAEKAVEQRGMAQQGRGEPPEETIALRPKSEPPAERPVYLRYSELRVENDAAPPGYRMVSSTNKRPRRIAGAILLGIGGVVVVGGLATFIGFAAGGKGDGFSVAAGALFGLPAMAGGFLLFGIPGGILYYQGRGPSNQVRPGEPGILYLPPAAPAQPLGN